MFGAFIVAKAGEIDLQRSSLRPPRDSLVAPKWPWLLLAVSLVLLGLAGAKTLFEVDLLDILMRYLRGL